MYHHHSFLKIFWLVLLLDPCSFFGCFSDFDFVGDCFPDFDFVGGPVMMTVCVGTDIVGADVVGTGG